MTVIAVLGWIAAACGSALSLPQLVRIIRARTSAGLSLLLWQLLMAAGIGWTHHGLLVTHRPNIWLPNLMMAITSAMLVRLIAKDRGLRSTVWILPLVLSGLLIGIDLTFGALAYGIATSIPQVIGAAAQLLDVIRSIDIAGVSVVFLGFSVVVQALWLIWGALAGEVSVVVSATCNGAVVLVTYLWYLLRRAGVLRAMPLGGTG